MNTINIALLPFTYITVALLLGGCIGGESIEGDETEASMVQSESTAEAADALGSQPSAAVYNGACGSGYVVIDQGSVTGGTVYLTYNSSTGKNCVITVRNTAGARLPMAARVSKAGQPWTSDSGDYTTYAGPVYVSAAHACIDWGGEINGSTFYRYSVHCG